MRFALCVLLLTSGVGARHSLGRSHIVVRAEAAHATAAEVERVRQVAEAGAKALDKLLPSMPRQFVVVLAGDGFGPDGALKVSTVSLETEEIVLYRFPGPGGGYEASVVHELVHASRLAHTRAQLPNYATGAGFIEEGFVELAATKAGWPSQGFPLYGMPVDVVAGHWLSRAEAVPLSALLRQHGTLNGRCPAQAYSQRLSFFFMLEERFGWEAVRRWAFATDGSSAEGFARVFGVPLSSVVASWAEWARDRYSRITDASTQADQYRRDSPAKYLPVCTGITPVTLEAGSP